MKKTILMLAPGLLFASVLLLSGCASPGYGDTSSATFSGKLDVRWVGNNYFLFVPNPQSPLTLERADGSTITPGLMFTDGGSIPKMFWGIEGYSPWGYAPAYMVHDWLFVTEHCKDHPDSKYTFEDSVTVMAEAMKAIMESNTKVRNYFVFDTVVGAIDSPIAEKLWEKGKCVPIPDEIRPTMGTSANQMGELFMSIDFE